MRVFKNKWFNHWAHREGISDAVLCQAAEEISTGKVEANLGGYLFKKRLTRAGAGKSGGYRVIVGYRRPNTERIVFLYAFAKSDRANISDRERTALSFVAEAFVSSVDEHIQELLAINSIWEVKCHD
ncbi:type II toxin-antitoxin system RelE/ParE family toxin [Candidatus Magnetominusculus xianensis]|uniref:type II toxin-antitoxin system RelE/ParE family toxin n=1 Tax=Candidatus Magnetominusculus xianensis TaxID=1748249 RepID=UPI000A10AD35|nr:type II toxin-antitoxin system RelE/ParE family toxin [Candidatus Magnetominusculus xianensis]MBF0404522.1 type II toxin-antitoxin system RelE/ParE family toxin [Nitrospirota bacterium]